MKLFSKCEICTSCPVYHVYFLTMPFIIEVSLSDQLNTAFFQIVMIQLNLRYFFSSGYSEIVSLNEMYIVTLKPVAILTLPTCTHALYLKNPKLLMLRLRGYKEKQFRRLFIKNNKYMLCLPTSQPLLVLLLVIISCFFPQGTHFSSPVSLLGVGSINTTK